MPGCEKRDAPKWHARCLEFAAVQLQESNDREVGSIKYLGRLPTQTDDSVWRDMKVVDGYAYIGSEAEGHGLQVFDLRKVYQPLKQVDDNILTKLLVAEDQGQEAKGLRHQEGPHSLVQGFRKLPQHRFARGGQYDLRCWHRAQLVVQGRPIHGRCLGPCEPHIARLRERRRIRA